MPNPEHVTIVKQGETAIHAWREQHPDGKLDLTKADLRGLFLLNVDLRGADLREARLESADLRGADLREANLCEVHLHEAFLNGVNMGAVRGTYRAHGLETTRFMSGTGAGTDALYFETCVRCWPERLVDWERLRRVGRLPLFGASYTALILIPILFYGLALYNNQVEIVRGWAEQVIVQPEHLLSQLASLVLARLHPRPIPQQSLLLLVSTILLVVGSTLHTFFCPSRIQEFSRDQWCDQLGHSLLHYWPLAWKYRYIRFVCAACYIIGGLGAGYVLLTKALRVLLFILKYSPYPWQWR